MSITELSEKLNYSKMTIRRDLEYLEQKGIIKKVHGGAFLIKDDNNQPSFQERIDEYSSEKTRIGKEAAKMITQGSVVFFDAGTTPLSIVDYIPDDIEFTAITAGLMTAIALCNKPKVHIINIGGNIHHTSYSSVNHISVDLIKKFNAELAFISTKAFIFPHGTYEALIPLIEIKQAIVSASKKVVLLADHSKFESRSLCLSIQMNNIHTIITDSMTPKSLTDAIRKENIEVIVV